MKQKIKIILAHPLTAGSGVVVVGTFLGSIFNFLLTAHMGR